MGDGAGVCFWIFWISGDLEGGVGVFLGDWAGVLISVDFLVGVVGRLYNFSGVEGRLSGFSGENGLLRVISGIDFSDKTLFRDILSGVVGLLAITEGSGVGEPLLRKETAS